LAADIRDGGGEHPLPQSEPGRDRRRRHNAERAAIVGTVVTVIALIVAILEWQFPQGPGGAEPRPSNTGDPPSSPPSQPPTRTPLPDAEIRYLRDLAPASGAINLDREAMTAGRDAHEVVLPCGSGRSNDQEREVRYQLRSRYAVFSTDIRIRGDADPDIRAQVIVLSDESLVLSKHLRLGQSFALSADVAGAELLTLRLRCESIALSAAFAEASLSVKPDS